MNVASLVDRHARMRPQHRAFITARGPRNWLTTRTRIASLAAGLRSSGVASGERVALLGRNSAEYFEALLAIAWAGAIAVPLNWRLAPPEIAFQLHDTGARGVIVDPEFVDLLDECSIEQWLLPADTERWLRDAPPVDGPALTTSNSAFGIFYTGGTTGVPKGVVLTHANLLANADNIRALAPYQADDLHLHVAPIFHLADLGYAVLALLAGSAHSFLGAFTPASTLEAIARGGVTHTLLAPAMVEAVLREGVIDSNALQRWRLLAYGGAPISTTALTDALTRLPCGLLQGYGQTEATHTIASLTPEEHVTLAQHPGRQNACGRAVPGITIQIQDGDGQPVASGAPGEVCVRGATVMSGYWQRPEETTRTLAGGWLHTGDVGSLDAQGYLTLLDRKKDMIVTGAENVYSVEVENALASHSEVAEAAVIAVPDARWGEHVHAIVVRTQGSSVSSEMLAAHCRVQIGGYKVPKSWSFVERLPRSALGKIRKEVLREPFWQNEARAIR